MARIKILSIDGGGIRGIIPARVMQAIEERAGKPLCQLFDYIVGTSTGGILAMGAALPDDKGQPRYRAADGLDFYISGGPRIFPEGPKYVARQFITAKYPARKLEQVFRERFGEATLGDSLTRVLVTAYATNLSHPKFFKSWDPKDQGYRMRDVARATSAAPTFFDPVELQGPKRSYTLIDGGVFANNPAMCGLADAIQQNPDVPLSDFLVVSLGAGDTVYPFVNQFSGLGWGVVEWMIGLRVFHLFLDGSIDAVTYQLNAILGPQRFVRFQAPLPDDLSMMDDTYNIPGLLRVANKLVNDQSEQLDRVVEKLLA